MEKNVWNESSFLKHMAYKITVGKICDRCWWEGALGKCKVCNKIEGCGKILVPKLDSFWKHARHKKVVTTIVYVATKEYYFLKTN
jgi:hypothetical protein